MQDSNQEQTTELTTAPGVPIQEPQSTETPTPPVKPAPPKTFLQQFQEMLSAISRQDSINQQIHMSFTITAAAVTNILDELETLKQQLDAAYILADEGKTINRANVLAKVTQIRIDAARAKLKKDEEDNVIRRIDSVVNTSSIVVYSNEAKNMPFAYGPVDKLPLELQSKLIGKKTNETVDSVKILAVYELVPKQHKGLDENENTQKTNNAQ